MTDAPQDILPQFYLITEHMELKAPWVSPHERLPEEGKQVLVLVRSWTKEVYRVCGSLEHPAKKFWQIDTWEEETLGEFEVLGWAELPEIPEI